VTEVGDPKNAIYETVEKLDIQLLVLGSHGRGVIQRLVANITCPCLS
jgi:nucleotide-binding universal stress UspA family protein